MLVIKRLIILMLLLCIITCSALTSQAYVGDDALNILTAMDVIQGDPDGNLRTEDLVKRSEFAKMAVLLSEHKDKVSINSKTSVFIDCQASHWAAPYVKVAAENGIIEGYPDGRFGPDDYITYTHAVTIALRLLGYTNEDFGFSYPHGQLGMALSLKLNSGIDKSDDEYLTRGDVAIVLSNMLSASKKDSTSDYINTLGYSIIDDVVLIATNDEDASVLPGKIHTSSGEYTIADDFDKTLIGKKGSVLLDSNSELLTVIESDIIADKYAVYTAGSELVSVYGSSGSMTLDCDDSTLCYDGIEKTNFGTLKNRLTTGDALVIGKDREGNIDYIILTGQDFNGPYTVRENATLPFDVNHEEFSFVRNGNKAVLSDIKKYDIVYVSKSLSMVFAYSKKVSGIYSTAVPNINSPKSVVVGGTQYDIESSQAFLKLSSGGIYNIGDTVVLLLGRNGGIADILDDTEDAMNTHSDALSKESNAISPEYALLSHLGAINLYDGAVQDGERMLTRGEFAKMAVMISSYRNTVSSGTQLSIFPDCPYIYWAILYIKVAVEKGIMSAYSDSKFHPEDYVNLAEALDAALKILGYQTADFADWPSSQVSLSESKGLTRGISNDAYDTLTADEAVRILYNTLCSTTKSGASRGIENIGYEYFEDAVIIATNKENSSVSHGKILTSEGTFSVESSFDGSDNVGKSGELLVYSGKVQMFNRKPYYYSENIVYSVVPGGIAIADGVGMSSLSVSDSTAVYIEAEKTNFSLAGEKIETGDSAYLCYDEAKRLKYMYIRTSNLVGPYVVSSPGSWYSQISGADASCTITKNGKQITSQELAVNDVLYYSSSLNTAFVYSEKVIGTLENASPTKDAPDVITVSGVNYQLETSDVSLSDINFGDTVVLCLGRSGKVARSYSASDVSLVGYLTQTGIKEFSNQNGEKYSSMYAGVVLADGTSVDFVTNSDYDGWINNVVKITFDSGKAKLMGASRSGDVAGVVDSDSMKIGNTKISPDIKILDVGYNTSDKPSIHKSIYPQRLDGINISKSDILYVNEENGYITELILNNVTGDAFSYGVITSANSNTKGMSASGSYTCDISGSTYSYSGGVYNDISKGNIVRIALMNGRVDSVSRLYARDVSVKNINYTHITLSDGTIMTLSNEVKVYKYRGTYDYTYLPLSEIVENFSEYTNFSVYADKAESKGGRVRVITVK